MSSSSLSQQLSVPLQRMEPGFDQDSAPLAKPAGVSGQMPTNPSSHFVDSDLQKPLLPTKRKDAAESSYNDSVNPPNKKNMQFQSTTSSQGAPGFFNKRTVLVSSKTNSPRAQTPKTPKAAAPEVSPKVQNWSNEAVRLKMRETLAAALSVGNQNKDFSNGDKSVPPDAPVPACVESQPHVQHLVSVGNSDGQKSQYNYVMPDTDGSFGDVFFAKDELLQGNGLSWAWDSELTEQKEVGDGIEQVFSSPQELASKIESELFKLFGGVNKKYKEKGRSLMFNLKDPNNPDLREKVLFSKISPKRLCSMTPEELASKELSEWRMAKAEELDKMIVLPDSGGDVRRLVKKTHKGEYEVVELEQDDGVSVEVSVGSSSLAHFQPKKKKTDHFTEKSVSEEPDANGGHTVSTEGADIMQELTVNELKDEGFLPPVVSLDEFMDSLNSEPPFENLPVDSKETKTLSGNDDPRTFVENSNEKERNSFPSFSTSIGECIWEGELQLTLSSAVSVIGFFKSGEKTSTKEWSGSVEIKGRVRLQAFEKFLQELPMSRSRAVMVVHFILKDASPEFHRSSLSEAVDSYIVEERVGFGEPSLGVEVYFCPPHERTTEMLSRLLSKDQTDILKLINDGFIGVVVWRRPHPVSANLPSSTSHNKHHRKHNSSRRQENNNPIANSNSKPQPDGGDGGNDDDDDVPPGFGPGVVNVDTPRVVNVNTHDVDDLPEFSFSVGNVRNSPEQGSIPTQPNTLRPVAEMRQLVYEYGQTGNGSFGTNWHQNAHGSREDDDMPEWQPQNETRHQPEGPSLVSLPNQVRPVMGPMMPVMAFPQPFNVMQNGWVLAPQPFPLFGLPPNVVLPGQQFGRQWRPEDPRNRGF